MRTFIFFLLLGFAFYSRFPIPNKIMTHHIGAGFPVGNAETLKYQPLRYGSGYQVDGNSSQCRAWDEALPSKIEKTIKHLSDIAKKNNGKKPVRNLLISAESKEQFFKKPLNKLQGDAAPDSDQSMGPGSSAFRSQGGA
jgi:hypothetical protein